MGSLCYGIGGKYQPILVSVSVLDLNQNSGFGHTLVVCTLLYIALILFSTKSEKSYILHKFDYLFKNGFDPVVWEGIRAE